MTIADWTGFSSLARLIQMKNRPEAVGMKAELLTPIADPRTAT